MKQTTSILTLTLALGASAHAAPFLAIGDNAELFITGQAGVRVDSNIYLTSDTYKSSDEIFDFSPGLELDFGKNSNTQGLLRFAENFTEFSDHDELNTSLASTAFNANYDDGKSKAAVYMSYDELNQNSVDQRPAGTGAFLIRSNIFATGTSGEVSVTEKSSVAGGVDYRWTDYRRIGFSDSDVVSLPFHYYYELTPKVDVGLGYRYRSTWLEFGKDSVDHFASVSARGEFTPKLTGKVDVGVTQRRFSQGNDTSLLGVDASLAYAISPKTSAQFGVSNGFDTNSQGDQQKNLAFNAQVSSALTDVWTVVAGAGYRAINYYQASNPRTDDYYETQVGVSYTINVNAKVTAAASYRQNNSEESSSNFDGTVFSLAVNLRY